MSLHKLSVALILSVGLVTASAQARDNEKPYVGVDYSIFTFDAGDSLEFEPHVARVRAGTVLGKYLAVEAHAGAGVKGDTVAVDVGAPIGMVNIRSDVEGVLGAFLRPQISLGAVHLYALAGYSYVKAELSLPATTIEDDQDDSDFSIGAGIELDLGAKWGVNASYIRYIEDVESIGAGVVYRF